LYYAITSRRHAAADTRYAAIRYATLMPTPRRDIRYTMPRLWLRSALSLLILRAHMPPRAMMLIFADYASSLL